MKLTPSAMNANSSASSVSDVNEESSAVHDVPIGDIIRRAKNLTPEQVEQIVLYQREQGLRFGDAAVALKMADHDDILWALSQQFHYPYSPDVKDRLNRELVVAANPFSDEAEIFRDLRSQLMAQPANGVDVTKTFAILSPESGDGKTFFAANMAVAFSQLGGRTLLVDADMRTPRMHKLFDIEGSSGLSAILSGRTETNVIHRFTDLPSLYLLPVGTVPPNPLELIQRPAFSLLLAELRNKFDHIVVDTPAATHGADARVIGEKCGAVLVIGRRAKSRMRAVQTLLSSVRRSRTNVVGMVLNDY